MGRSDGVKWDLEREPWPVKKEQIMYLSKCLN